MDFLGDPFGRLGKAVFFSFHFIPVGDSYMTAGRLKSRANRAMGIAE
jgi:hypothetical protein